ncbi:uncharacterized protein LOC135084934 [Ostrinia nubilalis]|uniref:uncharacterized protein LOC135084934 n=1 Tax=Ostrinia nubilalis TaxID=29057 RepID=UPI0030823701
MRLLWCLFAVIAVVASVPADIKISPTSESKLLRALSQSRENSRNSQLEQLILDLLETVRDIILNGSGVIPPLDPLNISQIDLDDEIIPFPGARVSLTDTVMSNLGTFVVDDLSVTMTSLLLQRYRIILVGRIPELEVEADKYDLDVSAMGVNVFGNGKLKLKIIDPKVTADLLVNLSIFGSNGLSLNVRECTVNFGLSAIEPEITGLLGHEGASDFVNLFLKDLVPTLVEFYEPEITSFLSETVHEIANDVLADLDLGDLIRP